MQVEKQRVRVIPDELETYRGVTAPIRKAVADKSEDAPVEIPKVSYRCQCLVWPVKVKCRLCIGEDKALLKIIAMATFASGLHWRACKWDAVTG